MLRDLDSRNGTMVGNQRVVGDWTLRPGDIVRIGRSQLVFVHRLAEAFADSTSVLRPLPRKDEPAPAAEEDEADALAGGGPTTITHRRGQTRFLEPGEEPAEGVSKMGRAAAKLCRLAFELAKAPDAATVADLACKVSPKARKPTPAPCSCCGTTFAASPGRTPWKSSPRGPRRSGRTTRSPPSWRPR